MEFNKGNLVINNENNRNIEFCKAQREKTLTLIEKSNTIQIKESYYSQGLKQAKIGFYFGLIGSTIGLLVIIGFLVFAGDKLWGTCLGVITEAVSLLIFKISDNALDRMGDFFDKLSKDSNIIKSIELSKSIKRDDTRDELRSKLALFLVGMNEDKSE